jgi:SAM-dependent methyltransferase
MIYKTFFPKHDETKLKDANDFKKVRESYLSEGMSKNLLFLLEKRFNWMNRYIDEHDVGAEIGSGAGLSEFFIKAKKLFLTDVVENDWLDYQNVSGIKTPFEGKSMDFVIALNVLHHIPQPILFLKEMNRVLRVGGLLIIQDPTHSLFTELILIISKHEGYSFEIDVFDEKNILVLEPDQISSANTVVSNLLFDDKEIFRKHVPGFEIILDKPSECVIFANSGGVNSKSVYLPLPRFLLKFFDSLDNILIKYFPKIFAFHRQIVLRKCD